MAMFTEIEMFSYVRNDDKGPLSLFRWWRLAESREQGTVCCLCCKSTKLFKVPPRNFCQMLLSKSQNTHQFLCWHSLQFFNRVQYGCYRTKVWFNLTRNVTANMIGQIISFYFRLLWIKVGGSFSFYSDGL